MKKSANSLVEVLNRTSDLELWQTTVAALLSQGLRLRLEVVKESEAPELLEAQTAEEQIRELLEEQQRASLEAEKARRAASPKRQFAHRLLDVLLSATGDD